VFGVVVGAGGGSMGGGSGVGADAFAPVGVAPIVGVVDWPEDVAVCGTREFPHCE